MPVAEAVQYCNAQGITAEDTNTRETGRLDKLARFTGHPLSALVQALQVDTYSFENLVPNKTRGPLSLSNKRVIRDVYSETSLATALAKYLNTTYQNVRLAQKGEFKDEPKKKPGDQAPPRKLTLAEKIHIRDNEADVPTADVARKYNARYQCVRKAQLGDFKESRTSWVTRTITHEQAAMLGLSSTLIKVQENV